MAVIDLQPVIVVLTADGAATARRIMHRLSAGEVHGYRPRVADAELFFDHVAEHLRTLFCAGRPLVVLCGAGIVVRALAPVLGDKQLEPAVVVVADTGSAVIPLLGAHHGGNALAKLVADALEVTSAVTTASDQRYAVALDAPPAGYVLAEPERYKAFAARLLAGESMRIDGDAPWLQDVGLPLHDDGSLTVRVSNRSIAADADTLLIRPCNLVVGVGCERGCGAQELIELVHDSLARAGLAQAAVAVLASIDLKSDELAVHAVAGALGVPARFFSAATLEVEASRLQNPSDVVFREVGCHGVAEGAALAAAKDGELVVAKTKSRRATCAIAMAPAPLDPMTIGRARGELMVVGLGPGGRETCTPKALASIERAHDLVGYSLYLNLAGLAAGDPRRHDFKLGEERERVRHALELAARGRCVALLCSGDPGIYAMASLVFEELETAGRADWRRVALDVVSGTSAMQAAAALAGAPLGHDFCAISLSDLLTPWADIERRIEAAAVADFVIAFYNPVSKRRTRQLARALEILRAQRPADTPVIVGRNLGRAGESLIVCALSELEVAQVDMLTVVLVGSTQTRRIARGNGNGDGNDWVYTPRGYSIKREALAEGAIAASPRMPVRTRS